MKKSAERFAEANAGLPPAVAVTPNRDNDTSVTRGPAIMKAGRLEPYEAASQAHLGEIPDFQGIRENVGRTIL